MEFFYNAKTVRLRSNHNKYLTAEDDEHSVSQDRTGSARTARWLVELIEGSPNNANNTPAIRLKSYYGKYLTATNLPFLLGMTGKKVVQELPRRLDSSVEWVPTKVGSQVRLMTRFGDFLRGNGGLPPWRNSVTHDVPYRTSSQDWILWDVHILEIADYHFGVYNKVEDPKPEPKSNPKAMRNSQITRHPGHGMGKVGPYDSYGSDVNSVSNGSDNKFQRQESIDTVTYSAPKHDGRQIFYRVTDDYGSVDKSVAESSFSFKGHNVLDLTHKLEENTGLEDIFVCMRSPLNGKLYPLRLQLPPNSSTMHIVVVPSTSTLAREFF